MMTIEEKAKAYDEALEKVRPLYKQAKGDNCPIWSTYEYLFPELKESEDERIRMALIKLMTVAGEHYVRSATGFEKEQLIAWLEKQKESMEKEYVFRPLAGTDITIAAQQAVRKANEGDRLVLAFNGAYIPVSKGYNCNVNKIVDMYDTFTEKQKEQKPAEKQDYTDLNDLESAIHRGFLSAGVENVPVEIIKETAQECLAQMKPAEWSEDYNEENLQTRFAFYTYKDDPSTLYLSNVFVEEASRNHGFGTRILRAAEKVAETLGAIQIRLKVKQDSPANAWYRKHGYGYMAFEDGYDWLEKNLEYMKPIKSERKPSEEHFQGLRRAIIKAEKGSDTWNSLTDLYEQLKKL